MNLRILETVEFQVDRIAALLESGRGGVGLRFLEEYRSVLKVLPDNPRFFPRVEDPMAGREVRHALVLRASYRVIFELRSEGVVLVSVLHSRQRPGAWHSSLTNV